MGIDISIETFLLVGSIMLFVSLLVGKTGSRFGVPILLLFLFIGVACGSEGLGIDFHSPEVTQVIGVIALNIILFSGGLDTRYGEIRPVMAKGLVLATAGVLLTAALTGLFIYWLTNHVIASVTFSLAESFLLASVMASTDSASVFGILRSRNMSLKENLRPLLELESGSNDPMAYMLTIVLIQFIQLPDISGWAVAFKFLQQFALGAAFGLLVNPSELLPVAGVSMLIGVFMILVSRPLSVFACLAPFRGMSFNARIFTSWVGLRGAVPIIFATYPWVAGVPQAKMIFNIVFFITILSLVIQGTSIPAVAKWLKLSQPGPKTHKLKEFDIEFSDDIKSAMAEITVRPEMLEKGNTLIDIPLPDKALVVMVKRGGNYFVPRGNTELEPGDSILVITDNEDTLRDTYRTLGVKAN